MNIKWEKIESLPIRNHLDTICENLKTSPSRFLVLTASTGAGKSTALPLALLEHFSGKILMLEPRRLAVLNIAERTAELLGEKTGETCGYKVHLESRVSSKTRFTVLTEAILTRMIQNDAELKGVSVVVIDEFHERSIHADLALALLKEVMVLRDDLFVVVMSATIDTKRLCSYLGGADFYSVPGKVYPVHIEYKGNTSVSTAIVEELQGTDRGAILVFLPGISEIRKTESELKERGVEAEILILHSSIPFSEQKKVLSVPKSVPLNSKRRVILSSSIAETSLTVPDVSVVIDSGLTRISSFNRRAGMQTLITQAESLFNAEQRAGRAGRLREGRCVRLWNKEDIRPKETLAEILRSDLSMLVLECAEWGVLDRKGLSFLDEIPETSWDSSFTLLKLLDCIDDRGITNKGKACLLLGTSVRLACVALSGLPYGKADFSTRIAIEYDSSINSKSVPFTKYIENLEIRVQKADKMYNFSALFPQTFTNFSTEYALLAGFPDRLGFLKDDNKGEYIFASGRIACLPKEAKRPFSSHIIAVDVDAGERVGKIYEWKNVNESFIGDFVRKGSFSTCNLSFEDGKVRKTESIFYGKVLIKQNNLAVTPGDYVKALEQEVKNKGLEILPFSDVSKSFLLRVQFFIEHSDSKSSEKKKELEEKLENLDACVKEWLSPFLVNTSMVREKDLYDALYYYLDGALIEKNVPGELKLPNGRKCKVVYEKQNGHILPIIEIIIQRIFGCFETPKIMGFPVLLKLLSPASRPLQVTSDLENFWKETWPEICSEMRGRYPKHNWDYKNSVN